MCLRLPAIGLGTYKTEDIGRVVSEALTVGYTLIDCAPVYHNQREIGKQLKTRNRDQIQVVSKVWSNSLSKGLPLRSCRQTLLDLQLDYLDLLLVHWPIAFRASDDDFPLDASGHVLFDSETSLEEIWRQFLEIRDLGLAKEVGVSNFNERQLIGLEESCGRRPHVNQVESHPLLSNQRLIDFCLEKDIQVMAYCPLARGHALSLEPVTRLAQKYDVTAAQVCIRWSTQRRVSVIPKSSSRKRLKENLEVFGFELTEEEMREMSSCDSGLRISRFDKFGANDSPNYPFV